MPRMRTSSRSDIARRPPARGVRRLRVASAHAADVPFSSAAVYGYGNGTNVYGVQGVWAPRTETSSSRATISAFA